MSTSPDSGRETSAATRSDVRVRASDADRAATTGQLQDAVARGLLTHEEGGDRISTALSARFVDELPPLTVDLPAAEPPAQPLLPGWRRLGSMTAAQIGHEIRAGMAAGPRSRRFAFTVLVAVLLVGLLVTAGALAIGGLLDGGWEQGMEMGQN